MHQLGELQENAIVHGFLYLTFLCSIQRKCVSATSVWFALKCTSLLALCMHGISINTLSNHCIMLTNMQATQVQRSCSEECLTLDYWWKPRTKGVDQSANEGSAIMFKKTRDTAPIGKLQGIDDCIFFLFSLSLSLSISPSPSYLGRSTPKFTHIVLFMVKSLFTLKSWTQSFFCLMPYRHKERHLCK